MLTDMGFWSKKNYAMSCTAMKINVLKATWV